MSSELAVLEYLQRQIDGTLAPDAVCRMNYPTAISRLLGFRIVGIGKAHAWLEMDADAEIHGNQQGTVHGGLLSELADAAIGTAHSTVVKGDESFTSIDLRITFFRPVWRSTLIAKASPVRLGRAISHYQCEIFGEGSKQVALASGTIMTLRGLAANGR